MWRRLNNVLLNLLSYPELSPDLQVRSQVRQLLRNRRPLSEDEWFEHYWRSRQIARPVADFIYRQLSLYAGIEVARLQPGDRLLEDLNLPLICWFDWEISLCEDFWQQFNVDVSEELSLQNLATLEDLLRFLNQELTAVLNLSG